MEALGCCECDHQADTVEELQQHLRTTHSYVFSPAEKESLANLCQECGQRFKRPTQLRKHIAVHHMKMKRFQCTLCSYQSYFISYVKEHFLSKHSQEALPKDADFKLMKDD